MHDWMWVCVIFFAGGTVQGASGFGFGLTSLALLANVADLRDASVMVVFGSLAINALVLYCLHEHFALDRVKPFLIAVVLAVPAGVAGLRGLDLTVLQLLLGGLLVLSAIQGLIPALAKHRWHPVWCGVPLGVLSGLFSGALGTGGPPAVAYVASQNFDRRHYVATMQTIFAFSGVVRVVSLITARLLTWHTAGLSLLGAMFAAAGAVLGISLLHRLSDRRVRVVVAIMLLGFGIRYLATAGIW
jgi:hypothetical protein